MEPGPSAAASETAALVALLRSPAAPSATYADRLEETRSARVILEEQSNLLVSQLLDEAAADIARWSEEGIRLLTLLDPDYPENLRAVYDRPPLLFLAGRVEPGDARSVAVIGSRRASPTGLEHSRAIAEHLIRADYTIVSGLAAGVDTAAHTAALRNGGRTIAVIGTGLEHAYPPQNAALQHRIATSGAVVSQFWPEDGPSRSAFPARNAVMSGLTLATIVVEATVTSGARTQIRAALRHGRPVLLAGALLDQAWACELAEMPGVGVIRSLGELDERLASIAATGTLVA